MCKSAGGWKSARFFLFPAILDSICLLLHFAALFLAFASVAAFTIEMIGESAAEAELTSLRGELKGWEKSFAEANGRKPTQSDIKANASVGKP
jgi:hypothetical protein